MMFGFKDEFEYFQCASCNCLQIKKVPEDLDKYYPASYYSFMSVNYPSGSKWRKTLHQVRASVFLKFPFPFLRGRLPDWTRWIGQFGIHFKSRILDVGSGNGDVLMKLHHSGFSDLTGQDIYIRHDYIYGPGIRVWKRSLLEIDGIYDFIMFNHSFEHMAQPREVLGEVAKLLDKDGLLMIRIPVVNNFAWNKYGTCWVQLDAPRHLFLHSVKSMHMLAADAGFEIVSIEYDSTMFQFWGSEKYLAGIPLRDERQPDTTYGQIRQFRRQVVELNKTGFGDQACFFLKKKILNSVEN